ncbi:hypothetical protein T484DRAFT_1799074, partial [Baffinella frigidus]
ARTSASGENQDLIITSQSGSFSADLPHARAHCVTYPFMITKERAGAAGGQKNEQFCNNCFCYVCDVKASECQGWLTVGHCHAQ